MSQPTLEIDLSLKLASLRVELAYTFRGQVLGIYGPSGSGKTSILESIAGLRPSAHGRIRCGEALWLDSANEIECAPEARSVGYVPQDHLLFPHLDVRANLFFGRKLSNLSPAGQARLEDEIIQVLELTPLLKRQIDTLSGGEKQRVTLGRALCASPKLLLLDEPLSALDPALRHRILPYLIRIKEHFKFPILIVSHNAVELQCLCDEVIALREGRILASGSTSEIFTHPQIYGHEGKERFQNILSAVVISNEPKHTLVSLDHSEFGAPNWILPPSSVPPKSMLQFGIHADQILVSLQPVPAISARNQIPAKVVRIQRQSNQVLLHTRVSKYAPDIVCELTHAAIEALSLKAGKPIYLIFKSSSTELF